MNKLFILILFFTALFAKAQGNKYFKESSEIGVFSKSTDLKQTRLNTAINEESVLNYLESKHHVKLSLSFYNHSPVAHYYLFQQMHNSVPVYGAEIKLTLNNEGVIIREDNGLLDIPNNFEPAFIEPSNALAQIVKGRNVIDFTKTPHLLLYNNQFLEVFEYKIHFSSEEYELYLINNQGKIILEKDLNSYYGSASKDSLVDLVIFRPDPLTKANKVYGGIYKDVNDQNSAVLDPLRDTVSVNVKFDNNLFKLESDYCVIKEFSAPVQPIVTSATPFFGYSRSHYGFEQVNAYYHIMYMQEHLQDMGFNLVNYKIEVDVNALNGSDNSQFSPSSNPPRLLFGEGGVDDAEDADVIIHEYSHAISYSANGVISNGTERETLEEGFGDYLGSSYSKMIDPYKWYNVFTWDGHNEFWNGRSGLNTTNKKYPVVFSGNIYEHTDLWVSTLMDINAKIGRQLTDKLVVESVYGYFTGMKFPDAAMLIVQADSLYNGGINVPTIWRMFYANGILPSNVVSIEEINLTNIQVWGTSNFAQGGELTLVFNNTLSATALIYDITGKLIKKYKISNKNQFRISGEMLNSGIYILKLQTEYGEVQTFKLLRN